MKLQIDRTSFFGRFSHSSTDSALDQTERSEKAAWIIQRWWKQLHLKQTASESFHYVHDIVSLEQAQHDSFSQLEHFILDPKTLNTTRKLLMHLEQTKDIVLPSRLSLSNVYRTERQFLSAYMIATKSQFIFESASDTDDRLLAHAEAMLKSFENLCAYMSTIYHQEDAPPSSPLAEKTPSADRVFNHFDHQRVKSDHLFMTKGREYLEAFHQKQMAYYEVFAEWEAKNCQKLAQVLINKYLDIESKRFATLNSFDPRMLELYEGYGSQQRTLKKAIISLIGEEGNLMLLERLETLQRSLEANKWSMSAEDVLLHELALNPKLRLPLESCVIKPQRNIEAAIAALAEAIPNSALILDVLEEIRNKLVLFTPNNRQQITRLQETFNRQALETQLQTMGLQSGLSAIIYSLIEEIKLLESPAHREESEFFLRDVNRRVQAGESSTLLNESLEFIYKKISQINHEAKNFQITQASGLIERNIVALEQKKFQERLSAKQFNLGYTLNWLDKFVNTPAEYRLDLAALCSKYLGSYISHALVVAVLREPKASVLHSIPETFYLDRIRMVHWHKQYQDLLYTVTALGYLETFCKTHSLTLSSDNLIEEKNQLLKLLNAGELSTPQEKADHLIATINQLLVEKHKELTLNDVHSLTKLVEKSCEGSNEVTKLFNKRLGDQLSYYLFKGYLPKSPTPFIKKYALEAELSQLGHEIVPILRLHTKVHGPFYQQQMEQRLWNPLFNSLRETKRLALPSLISPEAEPINEAHAYLHKFAFVLSGLALIQQMVVYSDMWNLNLTIKNSSLKEMANTFGLIDMIKNPAINKEVIEGKLLELAQHVAQQRELPFEEVDQQRMTRMLRLAKNEKSLGSKAFLLDFGLQ